VSSVPPGAPAKVFAFELVKLLLQVAWADHEVAPQEGQALIAFARRSSLDETEIAAVTAMVTGRTPLAPPNLSVLKPRRTEVLRAVKELLMSDLEVAEEEEEILSQIAALLG
jgi:uncharacterized tellurite resistance protein B-like protein